MTTPPSKPNREDAKVDAVRGSSPDVLFFNNSTFVERIVGGIVLFTMGIVGGIAGLNFEFTGEWGVFFGVVFTLVMALGVLFFVGAGWAVLTYVEKLEIDFSQQTYELHRAGLPRVDQDGAAQDDLPLHKTGSLSEVSHLRLHGFSRPVTRHSSGGYQVNVVIIWKNNRPQKFIVKSDSGIFWGKERVKKKLKTYAQELAARLQVPVMEDVES